MEPLSTVRGAVHVFRSNYTANQFCNASAWLINAFISIDSADTIKS